MAAVGFMINEENMKFEFEIKKINKRPHITDTSTQTDDLDEATGATEPVSELSVANAWVLDGPSLAQQVEQAAQSAMQRTGFVYEPTSGMYYDYNTGYYYNAEMGLYYDGNAGNYLYYEEETQRYVIHSRAATVTPSDAQAVALPAEEPNVVRETAKRKKKAARRKKAVVEDESSEEGECSDSSGSSPASLPDETKPATIPSEELTVPSEEPTIPSKKLTISLEEPTVPSEEPTISSEEPTILSEEPTISSEQPTIPSEYLTVPSEELTIPSKELTIPSEEPTISSEQLIVSSKEQTIPSEKLIISSKERTIPSEELTLPSEELTVPSEERVHEAMPENIEGFKTGVSKGQSLHKDRDWRTEPIKKVNKMPPITDTSTQTDDLDEATGATEPVSELSVANAWVLDGPSLAQQVEQAAQSAMQRTGFVYEPTSGMYYDYNTGYYYNAEMGLYYDGNAGNYLYYEEETQRYVIHSRAATVTPSDAQAVALPAEEPNVVRETAKRKKKAARRKKEVVEDESPEEGECSDSGGSSPASQPDETKPADVPSEERSVPSEELTVPSEEPVVWPPCMRVIVTETGVEGLSVGTLFIVTCKGGTLGREGADHAVLVPDMNVSKHHARFAYAEGAYSLVDLGSRNGTYLDGKRVSAAKRESDPVSVPHDSSLTVGSVSMRCHVHAGADTCAACEPGLVAPSRRACVASAPADRRSELTRLRRRFGLMGAAPPAAPRGYEDRATARRATVGSSHDGNEKTRTASVHEAIAEDNLGFRMLAKMGWTKGQALGKDGDGRTEPVLQEQREGKAGLGATTPPTRTRPGRRDQRKTAVWKKTQERYREASKLPTSDIFEDDDVTVGPTEGGKVSNLPSGDMFEEADVTVAAEGCKRRERSNLPSGDMFEDADVPVEPTSAERRKRKELFTLPSSPPQVSSVDERKNLVWRKTQQRLKKTRKGVGTVTSPPTSPREDDDHEAA